MTACSLYTNFDNFQGKQLKRKWVEEEDEIRTSPDHIVPQFSAEKKLKTDFPFSNLMRNMAAKYQPQPAASAPVYNPLIMSLFAPVNNPYSRLMAAMADISKPQTKLPSPTPSEAAAPAPAAPLDLSKPASETEIDVVSTDEEEGEDTCDTIPVAEWTPRQVSNFVKKIEGCEDYALIFEAEKITGSKLMSLTVHHLVQLFGVPLGQAVRIISLSRKINN